MHPVSVGGLAVAFVLWCDLAFFVFLICFLFLCIILVMTWSGGRGGARRCIEPIFCLIFCEAVARRAAGWFLFIALFLRVRSSLFIVAVLLWVVVVELGVGLFLSMFPRVLWTMWDTRMTLPMLRRCVARSSSAHFAGSLSISNCFGRCPSNSGTFLVATSDGCGFAGRLPE